MTCSIRKAVQGDEQRICELFIEMLQTIIQEQKPETREDFSRAEPVGEEGNLLHKG